MLEIPNNSSTLYGKQGLEVYGNDDYIVTIDVVDITDKTCALEYVCDPKNGGDTVGRSYKKSNMIELADKLSAANL